MKFLQIPLELLFDKELSSNDKIVLMTLMRYINKESGISYPSIEKIAEDTGISSATIKRSLKHLSNNNYISISKRECQAGKHNIYSNFKYKVGKENTNDNVNIQGNYTSNNSKRIKNSNVVQFRSKQEHDELEQQLLGWL